MTGDFAHVSLPKSSVQERIRAAFTYWRREFQAATYPGVTSGLPNMDPALSIAQQTFVEATCSDDLEQAQQQADIVFQLGALTAEQRAFLPDPTRHIAIATRTEFDRVKLRGKGFVYVSADSGPLRYAGETLADGAWSVGYGELLERVLIHELGHVFGLVHQGASVDVMAQDFPAFMLAAQFSISQPIRSFFTMAKDWRLDPTNAVNCAVLPGQYDEAKRFFSVPAEHGCFALKIEGDQLVVSSSESKGAALKIAGSAALSDAKETWDRQRVRIGISKDQKVLPYVSPMFEQFRYIPSAMVVEKTYSGIFVSAGTGAPRPVILTQGPNRFEIIGALEGKLLRNVVIGF